MIDLHCHILPGLDDGSQSLEESLEMARVAEEDGIRSILATPHTLNQVYDSSTEDIIRAAAALQSAIDAEGISVKIRPGSDAHMCADMVGHVSAGNATTVGNNGRYLLIEFPHQIIPPGAGEELYKLKASGITPIITHPERNLAIQNRPDILRDFVAMGCLAQVTAMSLTGEFGEEALIASHTMTEQRLVHIIASDAHSPDSRPPVLASAAQVAVDLLGDEKAAEDMVSKRPEDILEGKDVLLPDPVEPKKRKWWQIWG